MNPLPFLKHLVSCCQAGDWAKGLSPQEAWATCPEAEGMLLCLEQRGLSPERLMVAACAASAESTAWFMEEEKAALEVARRWAFGHESTETVHETLVRVRALPHRSLQHQAVAMTLTIPRREYGSARSATAMTESYLMWSFRCGMALYPEPERSFMLSWALGSIRYLLAQRIRDTLSWEEVLLLAQGVERDERGRHLEE